MELAIIVPVYNVERYLEKCVNSILAQRFSSIEIILVDDGSTDSSGILCDSFAQKDGRIKVYHKTNGGLMSAWKYGLHFTSARYIGFVDSDDWVDENMYSVMMEKANSTKADIVASGLIQEFDDGREAIPAKNLLAEGLYSRTEIREKIFPILISGGSYHTRGLQPHRVTKIFRREILLKSLDDCSEEVSVGEDLLTLFSALRWVQSIYVIHSFHPYHYRINSESIINKYSSQKYKKISALRKHMLEVNSKHEYDFTLQINTDFLKLWMMQMENEILYSGQSLSQLSRSIKSISNDEDFISAKEKSEFWKLPSKYKMYLRLMEKRLYFLIAVIRNIKK